MVWVVEVVGTRELGRVGSEAPVVAVMGGGKGGGEDVAARVGGEARRLWGWRRRMAGRKRW